MSDIAKFVRQSFLIGSLLFCFLIIEGCASHPEKLEASYVSPLQYKDYDCDQIAAEFERLSRRITQLYNSLESEADADDVQMGVGLLLLWPTLFWLEGGDGPQAVEYSQLKGEFSALEKVAIQKKCDPEIIPPNPEEQMLEKEKQKQKESEAQQTVTGEDF
jgi:hypothetical protein